MKKARILVNNIQAAILEEVDKNHYRLTYDADYTGAPVSLALPIQQKTYEFNQFPAFFEGLLPEGMMLDALLRKYKFDKHDYFAQILCVGHDVVGSVTIEELS